MKRWTLSIGLALLLFAMPALLSAQPTPQGRLVDVSNNPVASARLQFSGPQRYVAVSGSDGGFFLTDPQEGPPKDGRYLVTVRLGSRAHVFQAVTIEAGRVTPYPLQVPW